MTTFQTDAKFNLEAAAMYGNRCRVAIDFAVSTGNEAEADYAYLNARWAARMALAFIAENIDGDPRGDCADFIERVERVNGVPARNEQITLNGRTVYKSEYIAMVKALGRRELLRLLHAIGLKQGAAKRSDSDLALVLWNHVVSTQKAVR